MPFSSVSGSVRPTINCLDCPGRSRRPVSAPLGVGCDVRAHAGPTWQHTVVGTCASHYLARAIGAAIVTTSSTGDDHRPPRPSSDTGRHAATVLAGTKRAVAAPRVTWPLTTPESLASNSGATPGNPEMTCLASSRLTERSDPHPVVPVKRRQRASTQPANNDLRPCSRRSPRPRSKASAARRASCFTTAKPT